MAGYIGKNNLQITEQSANAMPSFSVSTATLTGTLSQAFFVYSDGNRPR